MKIDGGCSCGAITIEGEADPEKVQICHCTDCQTSTGTAFRVSIPVPGNTFKMTGQPNYYLKTTADSGKPRLQAFCGKCGSPIPRRRRAKACSRPTWCGSDFAPARSAGAAAATMVALGAVLGTALDAVPKTEKQALTACYNSRHRRIAPMIITVSVPA